MVTGCCGYSLVWFSVHIQPRLTLYKDSPVLRHTRSVTCEQDRKQVIELTCLCM